MKELKNYSFGWLINAVYSGISFFAIVFAWFTTAASMENSANKGVAPTVIAVTIIVGIILNAVILLRYRRRETGLKLFYWTVTIPILLAPYVLMLALYLQFKYPSPEPEEDLQAMLNGVISLLQ